MRDKAGFSLVELGITVFIITIISAVVLTGLSHYRQKAQVVFQQKIIEQSLAYAKQTALAKQDNVDVLFFDNSFTIQTDDEILEERKLSKPFSVSSLRLGYNAAGNPRFAGTLYLYRQGRIVARMTSAVGSGILTWTRQ